MKNISYEQSIGIIEISYMDLLLYNVAIPISFWSYASMLKYFYFEKRRLEIQWKHKVRQNMNLKFIVDTLLTNESYSKNEWLVTTK